MKKTLAAIALLAAAGLTLTACGDSTDSPDTGTSGGASSASFNDADVTFAQQMIPHHEQAVQMSQLAESHGASAEVRKLASDIEAAQGPEIETMKGWLEDWGQDVPSDLGHGDKGHDMGASEMPGMMDAQQMDDLDRAQGAAWDRMFLQMMVRHHEGAIEMARTEVADGENPDAVALAGEIIDAQQAEIDTMQGMLGS